VLGVSFKAATRSEAMALISSGRSGR